MKKNIILKTLVGSRAHGIADEDSDYDYRGVYVEPTDKILSIGYRYKGTHWIESEGADNTAYEIAHFLKLATKSNSSILEVFVAPVMDATDLGWELKDLFPYVWNAKHAFNAFRGYSKNQRKKFFKDEMSEKRKSKYACAWLRTLYNLCNLLQYGSFSLSVTGTVIEKRLRMWRAGYFSKGEVVEKTDYWDRKAVELFKQNPENPNENFDKVNNFLIKVRRNN